ncbi:hypothetical protein MG293_000349 [Ovis ammon polii]|uniref:Alpha/beta hydrolase fold-3 domain-containing protein n=1 Tax=Ovis ammon polii TaxID=230172 RepID=A0AAD4YH26_OVIAM|nr:hypothetical protein MG293_000349 [Ovis ammon polii]
MGYKTLCFGLTCILFAFYVYTPMPENIEEQWKIRITDAAIKTTSLMAMILEKIGLKSFETLYATLIKMDYTQPVSDENVTVMDTTFSDIPDKILAKYGVDPNRVCISGDSSGGTLAAGVTQLIQNDPELKNKLKAQALIYPGLQLVDVSVPSHREYEHGPLLPWKVAIKLGCLYFTQDRAIPQAMMKNQHMPHGSMHLFKLVNWSTFLPEEYKKNHVYTEPILGRLNPSYSILLDTRLSPLAVNDSQLQNLPLTYILTCQHDILRDDGLMYVSRLRNVGVKVFHDHMEDGIHGALSFMASPIYLKLGIRIKDKYINWLEENLNVENTSGKIHTEQLLSIDRRPQISEKTRKLPCNQERTKGRRKRSNQYCVCPREADVKEEMYPQLWKSSYQQDQPGQMGNFRALEERATTNLWKV